MNDLMTATRGLRVLMIVESSAGGTGRHVLDLCEGLMARGCEVHLVHSNLRIDAMFRDRLATLPSLQRLTLPIATAVGPKDALTCLAIRKYMRTNGPFDVIHGHSSKGGALARLVGIGTSAQVFYTLHGLIMMDPCLGRIKKFIYLSIERGLKLVTDRIIAVSPEEQRAAIKNGLGESRVSLVPNGVGELGLASRDQARFAMGVANSEIVIGFVGRLVDQKAPHVLLAAFEKVVAAHPRSRLAMIGDGPLMQPMRDMADRLNIADRVLWLGERDARELFAGFDLFALSSRKEGLPYVVLEAMAAGIPVVATVAAGVEILIDPGVSGEVVATDDVEGFAKALNSLVGNPKRLKDFARSSRERAKLFTIDQMVDRTYALYPKTVRDEISDPTLVVGST